MAMALTFPEWGMSWLPVPFFDPLMVAVSVTSYNNACLQDLVQKDPNTYPGAGHVQEVKTRGSWHARRRGMMRVYCILPAKARR